MITLEISDKGINEALARIAKVTGNPSSVLNEIGEILVDSTKRRFSSSTGPDGSRWAPNSPVTILQYLGKYSGSFKKKGGGLTKRGLTRASNKKPLIGETGSLSSQIFYQMQGNDTLLVGSPLVQAAAQQFGMKKGFAGRSSRGPIPWGDIPARPFLGLSSSDRVNILDLLENHLI